MGSIPSRKYEQIPSCCESVNSARSEFTNDVANLIQNGLNAVGSQELNQRLNLIDKIKTAAFDAFSKLLKLDPEPECCLALSQAIRAYANLILTLSNTIDGCELRNLLGLYLKGLKLILEAAKSKKTECCLAVGNAITDYSAIISSELEDPENTVTQLQLLQVTELFLDALKRLLKYGKSDCCEAAGSAILLTSLGYLRILQNLGLARDNGYLGADSGAAAARYECEVRTELRTYESTLEQIVDAASARCSKCCSEVVLGIGRFYIRLGPLFYRQIAGLVGVTDSYYLAYLNILRKIRGMALWAYEQILRHAKNKDCCEAVSQGLAETTINFLGALANLFIQLANQVNAGDIVEGEAICFLKEFAQEYPPLVKQILSGVLSGKHDSSSTCSDSSYSSSCSTSSSYYSSSSKYSKRGSCGCKSRKW